MTDKTRVIVQKAFDAAWEAMGWDNQNPQATEAQERFVAAYETAKLASLPDADFEAWPDNVVAERHEVSGKWVLWYLTDEQAARCQRALPPLAEKQCGICGDYHEGELPRACETGDGE